MSRFLLGPISGALAAGGLYYGFSSLMDSRTRQHIADLATLSNRLTKPPSVATDTPPSAAMRIVKHSFIPTMHERWNQVVVSILSGFRGEAK